MPLPLIKVFVDPVTGEKLPFTAGIMSVSKTGSRSYGISNCKKGKAGKKDGKIHVGFKPDFDDVYGVSVYDSSTVEALINAKELSIVGTVEDGFAISDTLKMYSITFENGGFVVDDLTKELIIEKGSVVILTLITDSSRDLNSETMRDLWTTTSREGTTSVPGAFIKKYSFNSTVDTFYDKTTNTNIKLYGPKTYTTRLYIFDDNNENFMDRDVFLDGIFDMTMTSSNLEHPTILHGDDNVILSWKTTYAYTPEGNFDIIMYNEPDNNVVPFDGTITIDASTNTYYATINLDSSWTGDLFSNITFREQSSNPNSVSITPVYIVTSLPNISSDISIDVYDINESQFNYNVSKFLHTSNVPHTITLKLYQDDSQIATQILYNISPDNLGSAGTFNGLVSNQTYLLKYDITDGVNELTNIDVMTIGTVDTVAPQIIRDQMSISSPTEDTFKVSGVITDFGGIVNIIILVVLNNEFTSSSSWSPDTDDFLIYGSNVDFDSSQNKTVSVDSTETHAVEYFEGRNEVNRILPLPLHPDGYTIYIYTKDEQGYETAFNMNDVQDLEDDFVPTPRIPIIEIQTLEENISNGFSGIDVSFRVEESSNVSWYIGLFDTEQTDTTHLKANLQTNLNVVSGVIARDYDTDTYIYNRSVTLTTTSESKAVDLGVSYFVHVFAIDDYAYESNMSVSSDLTTSESQTYIDIDASSWGVIRTNSIVSVVISSGDYIVSGDVLTITYTTEYPSIVSDFSKTLRITNELTNISTDISLVDGVNAIVSSVDNTSWVIEYTTNTSEITHVGVITYLSTYKDFKEEATLGPTFVIQSFTNVSVYDTVTTFDSITVTLKSLEGETLDVDYVLTLVLTDGNGGVVRSAGKTVKLTTIENSTISTDGLTSETTYDVSIESLAPYEDTPRYTNIGNIRTSDITVPTINTIEYTPDRSVPSYGQFITTVESSDTGSGMTCYVMVLSGTVTDTIVDGIIANGSFAKQFTVSRGELLNEVFTLTEFITPGTNNVANMNRDTEYFIYVCSVDNSDNKVYSNILAVVYNSIETTTFHDIVDVGTSEFDSKVTYVYKSKNIDYFIVTFEDSVVIPTDNVEFESFLSHVTDFTNMVTSQLDVDASTPLEITHTSMYAFTTTNSMSVNLITDMSSYKLVSFARNVDGSEYDFDISYGVHTKLDNTKPLAPTTFDTTNTSERTVRVSVDVEDASTNLAKIHVAVFNSDVMNSEPEQSVFDFVTGLTNHANVVSPSRRNVFDYESRIAYTNTFENVDINPSHPSYYVVMITQDDRDNYKFHTQSVSVPVDDNPVVYVKSYGEGSNGISLDVSGNVQDESNVTVYTSLFMTDMTDDYILLNIVSIEDNSLFRQLYDNVYDIHEDWDSVMSSYYPDVQDTTPQGLVKNNKYTIVVIAKDAFENRDVQQYPVHINGITTKTMSHTDFVAENETITFTWNTYHGASTIDFNNTVMTVSNITNDVTDTVHFVTSDINVNADGNVFHVDYVFTSLSEGTIEFKVQYKLQPEEIFASRPIYDSKIASSLEMTVVSPATTNSISVAFSDLVDDTTINHEIVLEVFESDNLLAGRVFWDTTPTFNTASQEVVTVVFNELTSETNYTIRANVTDALNHNDGSVPSVSGVANIEFRTLDNTKPTVRFDDISNKSLNTVDEHVFTVKGNVLDTGSTFEWYSLVTEEKYTEEADLLNVIAFIVDNKSELESKKALFYHGTGTAGTPSILEFDLGPAVLSNITNGYTFSNILEDLPYSVYLYSIDGSNNSNIIYEHDQILFSSVNVLFQDASFVTDTNATENITIHPVFKYTKANVDTFIGLFSSSISYNEELFTNFLKNNNATNANVKSIANFDAGVSVTKNIVLDVVFNSLDDPDDISSIIETDAYHIVIVANNTITEEDEITKKLTYIKLDNTRPIIYSGSMQFDEQETHFEVDNYTISDASSNIVRACSILFTDYQAYTNLTQSDIGDILDFAYNRIQEGNGTGALIDLTNGSEMVNNFDHSFTDQIFTQSFSNIDSSSYVKADIEPSRTYYLVILVEDDETQVNNRFSYTHTLTSKKNPPIWDDTLSLSEDSTGGNILVSSSNINDESQIKWYSSAFSNDMTTSTIADMRSFLVSNATNKSETFLNTPYKIEDEKHVESYTGLSGTTTPLVPGNMYYVYTVAVDEWDVYSNIHSAVIEINKIMTITSSERTYTTGDTIEYELVMRNTEYIDGAYTNLDIQLWTQPISGGAPTSLGVTTITNVDNVLTCMYTFKIDDPEGNVYLIGTYKSQPPVQSGERIFDKLDVNISEVSYSAVDNDSVLVRIVFEDQTHINHVVLAETGSEYGNGRSSTVTGVTTLDSPLEILISGLDDGMLYSNIDITMTDENNRVVTYSNIVGFYTTDTVAPVVQIATTSFNDGHVEFTGDVIDNNNFDYYMLVFDIGTHNKESVLAFLTDGTEDPFGRTLGSDIDTTFIRYEHAKPGIVNGGQLVDLLDIVLPVSFTNITDPSEYNPSIGNNADVYLYTYAVDKDNNSNLGVYIIPKTSTDANPADFSFTTSVYDESVEVYVDSVVSGLQYYAMVFTGDVSGAFGKGGLTSHVLTYGTYGSTISTAYGTPDYSTTSSMISQTTYHVVVIAKDLNTHAITFSSAQQFMTGNAPEVQNGSEKSVFVYNK
jgi:hypothetical protein